MVRALADALRLGNGTAERWCAVLIIAAMICFAGLIVSVVMHVPIQNGLLVASGAFFVTLGAGTFFVLGPTDDTLEAAVPAYSDALVEARRARARRRAAIRQADEAREEAEAERREAAERAAATRCPYCKEPIRPDALKCKHCGEFFDDERREASAHRGQPPKRIPRSNARQRHGAVIAGIGLIALLLAIPCGGLFVSSSPQKPSGTIIPYEVLKNVKGKDNRVLMDILVAESASKQDVLALAESLQREFAGRLSLIIIFDSRAAWRQFEGETGPFSERELRLHWLASVEPGKIFWDAKNRDH